VRRAYAQSVKIKTKCALPLHSMPKYQCTNIDMMIILIKVKVVPAL